MPSSRRVLIGLISAILFASTGCRKDSPKIAVPISEEQKIVSLAPTPEDVGPTRQTLDLRPAGIWAKIDVPEKTSLTIVNREECLLKCGTSFSILISRVGETPDAAKARLVASKKTPLEQTDAGFIEEIDASQKPARIVWRHFNPYPLGYSLSSTLDQKLVPSQIERMLESIKTFQPITVTVEEMTRSQKAIVDFRQVGATIIPKTSGLDVEIPWNQETQRLWPRIVELNRIATIRIQGNGYLSIDHLKTLASCVGLGSMHFKNISINEADWAALETSSSLREIRIENSPSKPMASEVETLKLIEKLAKLPAIRSLVFRRFNVDEAVCKSVCQLAKSKLAEIGFEAANLTGRELKFLSEHRNWLGLHFADNPLVNGDLINLRELKQLQSVDLSGCKVDERGCSYFSDSPITSLKLSRTDVTEKGVESLLKNFPKVHSVDLSATMVGVSGLELLSKWTQLRNLNVAHLAVTPKTIELLSTCIDLRTLGLANTPVKLGEVSKSLEVLARLELLDLRATDAEFASVEKFVKARPDCHLRLEGTPSEELKIAETSISDPIPVKPLTNLPAANAEAIIKKYDGKVTRSEVGDEKPISELAFNSPEMTDSELAQLRNLKSLEKLYLNDCKKITEVGIASLGEMPNLTQLSIAKTSVTSNICTVLPKFKRLTTLELPDLKLSKKHLILLSGLKEMESIRGIRVPNQPEVFVDFLAGFPNLHRFDWSVIEWNDRRIRKLKALTGLEILEIRGDWQGNGVLELAAGFQNLKELTIQSDLISDAGLKTLEKTTALRKLRIEGRRFGDGMLQAFRNNAELEILRVHCPGLTDRGTSALRSFQKLLEVDLHEMNIGDAGLQNLVDANDLEWIDLSDTRVTDDGLKFLKEKQELRKLDLSRTAITGVGFKQIASLQRLSRCVLSRCRLTKTGLEMLAKVATIEELDLSDVQLTDDAIGSLKELPALQRLRINRNLVVTDKLADLLVTFPAINEISVIGTKMTSKGLAVLRKKEGLVVISE